MYTFYQQLLVSTFLLPFVRLQMNLERMSMCNEGGCEKTENVSRTEYGRLFQFNSEQSKIRVELAFAVPFITIPVPFGKDKSDPINVDLGALTAGGVISAAAYLFAPNLFTGLQPTATLERSLKNEFSDLWGRMERGLQDRDIDAAVCTQRAVCQAVHSAQSRMHLGRAGSFDKIVDGLVSNSWLQRWLAGTAISEAVSRGKNTGDCTRHYHHCKVTHDGLRSTLSNLLNESN